MKIDLEKLLILAKTAVKKADTEILNVYSNSDFKIEHKTDESPLTLADKNSHKAILAILSQTDIPIISEEGIIPDYEIRKNWEYFWLVDPLDGTKEFIKRNGDFTVNVALIKNDTPILGVVSIPVEKTVYWAVKNKKSFKENADGKIEQITVSARQTPVRITVSRSHLNQETKDFISKFPNSNLTPAGSSKKIIMVAEGKVDIYPRLAPTMEWDIAAASVIAKEAGATVENAKTGHNIKFNKPDLHNPNFIISN